MIDLNKLRTTDPQLAHQILNAPLTILPTMTPSKISGTTGTIHTTDTLTSKELNKLVVVEGIVVNIKHNIKIQKAIFLHNDVFYESLHYDHANPFNQPTNTNPHEFEQGLSKFVNCLTFTIQEDLKTAKVGHIPCTKVCVFEENFEEKDNLYNNVAATNYADSNKNTPNVNRNMNPLTPGTKIRAHCIYRAIAKNIYKDFKFETILVILNYEIVSDFEINCCGDLNIEVKDVVRSLAEYCKNIRPDSYSSSCDNISGQNMINATTQMLNNTNTAISPQIPIQHIHTLINSQFCPTIYGHNNIKLAIVLQIIGGYTTYSRSDINILLVGDPGTGKSQMLRFVPKLTKCRVVNNLTSAGLTACVVDGKIECGAMVLCNGGVCCIDEFDKIPKNDIMILHEVMEQQSITINKGGVHCCLDAKCGVLAAANPILGVYDESVDNLGFIGDALLSRFDLVFAIKDGIGNDFEIARHIIGGDDNTFSENRGVIGTDINLSEKRVRLDTTSYSSISDTLNTNDSPLHLLKQIINIAKTIKPTISDSAHKKIVDEYVRMRKSNKNNKTNAVTTRTLESLIRLCTAHARLRFSSVVEECDVDISVSLLCRKRSLVEVLREFKEVGSSCLLSDVEALCGDCSLEIERMVENDVLVVSEGVIYFV